MSIFEDNNIKNTSVSELGEFGLIDHITKSFRNNNKSTIKGVGDDAAVIEYSDNRYRLLSTDMLGGDTFRFILFSIKTFGL